MDIRKLKPVLSGKSLKNNVPFYLLYSLNNQIYTPYAFRSVEDSFLRNRSTFVWEKLWFWAQQISHKNITVETVIGMIYTGWQHFSGKDIYRYYFPALNNQLRQLDKKYPINTILLLQCIVRGLGQKDWYAETHAAFVAEFSQYDIGLFIQIFAITSPQNHPGSNLIMAIEAYECFCDTNRSVQELDYFINIKNMLIELEGGYFEDKMSRRKVINHGKALSGDIQAVTVDSWILQACELGKLYLWKKTGKYYLKCRKCEYDLIEYYF